MQTVPKISLLICGIIKFFQLLEQALICLSSCPLSQAFIYATATPPQAVWWFISTLTYVHCNNLKKSEMLEKNVPILSINSK